MRLKAAEALGKLGNNRAVKPLTEALAWTSWVDYDQASRVIINGLKELGSIDIVVEPLLTSFKIASKGEDITKTIVALGWIGDERAVEPLIELCLTSGWSYFDVRNVEKSIKALGRIGDARAVKPLISMIQHSEYRKEAVSALECFKNDPSAALAIIQESSRLESEARLRRNYVDNSPPPCTLIK